jgi:hypothetical protein
LFASEAYQQYRSLGRFNENTTSPTDTTAFRSQNDKIIGNVFSVGMRHFLTPRDIWLVNGNYILHDYSNQNSQDSWSTMLGTTYRHDLSQRTTIGARGSWIQQSFERDLGNNTVTNYYNISGLLEHHFSRTLSLEISAGPTLIDGNEEAVNFSPKFGARSVGSTTVGINANDCPVLNDSLPHQPDPDLPNYNPHVSTPGFGSCNVNSINTVTPGELNLLGYPTGTSPLVPGGSPLPQGAKLTEFGHPYEQNSSQELVSFDDSGVGGSEFTYFAQVALIKDWELWHLELAYDRSNNDSGSFGASSVQDAFEATVRWHPAELWSIELIGAYSLIDQASDIAVPTGLVLENGPVPAGVDSISQIATVQRLIVKSESNAVSYTTASVSLTATRRLTYNSRAFAQLYWYQQDQNLDLPNSFSFNPVSSSSVSNDNSWSTLTFWIGLEWQFDTLKFEPPTFDTLKF